MSAVTTVGDLSDKHIEQEVRVGAEGHSYGALSGALGLLVQMPDAGLTTLALWRGGKCVQVTIPSTTEVSVKEQR